MALDTPTPVDLIYRMVKKLNKITTMEWTVNEHLFAVNVPKGNVLRKGDQVDFLDGEIKVNKTSTWKRYHDTDDLLKFAKITADPKIVYFSVETIETIETEKKNFVSKIVNKLKIFEMRLKVAKAELVADTMMVVKGTSLKGIKKIKAFGSDKLCCGKNSGYLLDEESLDTVAEDVGDCSIRQNDLVWWTRGPESRLSRRSWPDYFIFGRECMPQTPYPYKGKVVMARAYYDKTKTKASWGQLGRYEFIHFGTALTTVEVISSFHLLASLSSPDIYTSLTRTFTPLAQKRMFLNLLKELDQIIIVVDGIVKRTYNKRDLKIFALILENVGGVLVEARETTPINLPIARQLSSSLPYGGISSSLKALRCPSELTLLGSCASDFHKDLLCGFMAILLVFLLKFKLCKR